MFSFLTREIVLCKPCMSVVSRSVPAISLCVWVGMQVCSLLWNVFSSFLKGILSMKTSDLTKYCDIHQGRYAQCNCLFLRHHSFFKQSFNSKKLPKTHFDTAFCATGINVDTWYCTFSITFCKSVSFITVQSTNVVFQIRILSMYS